MAEEYNIGQMVHYMKDIGEIVNYLKKINILNKKKKKDMA